MKNSRSTNVEVSGQNEDTRINTYLVNVVQSHVSRKGMKETNYQRLENFGFSFGDVSVELSANTINLIKCTHYLRNQLLYTISSTKSSKFSGNFMKSFLVLLVSSCGISFKSRQNIHFFTEV